MNAYYLLLSNLNWIDCQLDDFCNSGTSILTDSLYWQHTPRVITDIPDANDATFDHERLSERLIFISEILLSSYWF